MSTTTIVYIGTALIISVVAAVFMYGFRAGPNKTLNRTLGVLRALSLFLILLLLINPEFENKTYTIEKPKLPVLIDNSASVRELNQDENLLQLLDEIEKNEALNNKFEISYYSFGNQFKEKDSLTFSENQTNIAEAITGLNEIFRNQTAPAILFSDGNQTFGNDYEFKAKTFKNPIYSIILGDTATHSDLKIEHLNSNRYSYLKNKSPVEVILTYSGNSTVQSEFVVRHEEKTVFRQPVKFSKDETVQTIQFNLESESVGIQKYTAEILPLENEKNKINNSRQFAVEVIDQSTRVLIVSALTHPDTGALIKAIKANEHREAEILKPLEAVKVLDDYQLIVLYQPDRNFASVFSALRDLKKNSWIFSGNQTEWTFLNSAQPHFIKKTSRQKEEVQAELNSGYTSFAVRDIGFEEFPPLQTQFGEFIFQTPADLLLEQTIQGIPNENPMLATVETEDGRVAIWDGEGLWRWRARTYLTSGSFQDFDDFIGNMVQFLASQKRRTRLDVSSESFYYNNNPVLVSAQYFDKNYVFDPRASLQISLKNPETQKTWEFPMLLKNNYFEVDLNQLPAGTYEYTISVSGENISAGGNFTILEFNMEKQFLNADVNKLTRVSEITGGNAYLIADGRQVIQDLILSEKYQPVQKSHKTTTPVIDWKLLLGLIVLVLATEWFIRKYNGLV